MTATRTALGLCLAAVVLIPPAWAAAHHYRHFRNLRVVEPGVLYRSGQLTESGLREVVRTLGIKTVVSLRFSRDGEAEGGRPDEWEGPCCESLGVRHVRVHPRPWFQADAPCPSEGPLAEFLAVADDPARRPVLVHCLRGVHRTGAYCAAYRITRQGWATADALRELERLGYDNLYREWDVRNYLEDLTPTRASASSERGR